MTDRVQHTRCPEETISALLALVKVDGRRASRDLDGLLKEYPADARLHFMKGSLLASEQDFAGAHTAMRRAVDLSPDYAIARFQLGLLLLTSGKPHAAQEAWGPLHTLPPGNYLRLFVVALSHLIRDEFDDTVRLLQQGIKANEENPALNHDMQLIIDEVQAKSGDRVGAPVSSVDFLLQQAALKATRH